MKIHYGRHARRRRKLYKVDQARLEAIVTELCKDQRPSRTRLEFLMRSGVPSLPAPLKVVYIHEKTRAVVITIYPLKRKVRREDIIR